MTDTTQAAADAAATTVAADATAAAGTDQATADADAAPADSAVSTDAAAASADSQAAASEAAVSPAVATLELSVGPVFDLTTPPNLYQVMLKQMLCFAEANGLRVVDVYDEACEHVRVTVAAL